MQIKALHFLYTCNYIEMKKSNYLPREPNDYGPCLHGSRSHLMAIAIAAFVAKNYGDT